MTRTNFTCLITEKTPKTGTPRPGPKSKTRPGPKSKTKAASPKASKAQSNEDSEEVPDLSDTEEIMKPNKEYIRKRKKLVLTMEDLEPEASDEEFTASTRTPTTSTASRKMPKRSASKKPKLDTVEEEEDDDEKSPSVGKNSKKTITDYFGANDRNVVPKRSARKCKKVVADFSDESE